MTFICVFEKVIFLRKSTLIFSNGGRLEILSLEFGFLGPGNYQK